MPKESPTPPTPKTHKGPPAELVEARAKELAAKPKIKDPPALTAQLQQRPSADKTAKAASTDTPVKLEPKPPKYPPPKRTADTTASSSNDQSKRIKQEQHPEPPPAPPARGINKIPTAIPAAPTRPAPSPPAKAGPIEPPTPPKAPSHQDRSRTPNPPKAPAHSGKTPRLPAPPKHAQNPLDYLPTPPAPPGRSDARSSGTTDPREPLPRQRPDDHEEEFLPSFEFEFLDDANVERYVEVMNDFHESIPNPLLERERRRELWDRIVELAHAGVSTGSRILDRCIRFGLDSVDNTDDVYDVPYVPTPEEHFMRQDPGEQCRFFRPRLMISMTDQEFSIGVLQDLRDLGRNVLAGRAVRPDHPTQTSPTFHNVTTYYLTMVVLNLGNIQRMPWFANRKQLPREIRDVPHLMKDNLVLPYLVVNNPGHIITLSESYDFSQFRDLCIENNVIEIQCMSRKRHSPHNAPPIAIFVKSSQGMVEVIHHWDIAKETGANTDGWLVHGVLARCIFGPQSHNIDYRTRERTEHRYYGEDISTYAYSDTRFCTHGIINVTDTEDELEDPNETYKKATQRPYFVIPGLPESFVKRLGLNEVRVLTIHLNSYAFQHAIRAVRDHLRLIFAKAIFAYVDFITGDFNLFCNRQFTTDQGGSVYGGIVIEILDQVTSEMNGHIVQRVTYNVSSSTPAQAVFQQLEEGDANSDLDCMMCISLFYNKQETEDEPQPLIVADRFLSHDYSHNVLERPRQLSNYDLCLKQTDADWHLPLIVRIHAHFMRNWRTRGPGSQAKRAEQQRECQRQAEGDQQYGRYNDWYGGQDTGPYSRRATGSQYRGWYGGH